MWVKENLFIVCKTPMAKSITRRTLAGFRRNVKVNSRYFEDLINSITNKKEQFIKRITDGQGYWKANNDRNMKFNAVVGNPPYQESSSVNNRQNPIYHYFYEIAEALGDIYTLISPARFLFNAGLTPTEWNEKMLNDKHFKVVNYIQDSSACFPRTDIKGGVAIVIRNKKESYGSIKKFIPNESLRCIASKFKQDESINLSSIIFGGRSDLKFNQQFLREYPQSKEDRLKFIQLTRSDVTKLGQNEEFELKSSTFEALPYAFEETVSKKEKYYHLLGLVGTKRTWKYVRKEYMSPRYPDKNNISSYKVFIPKANGSGLLGEQLSKSEIGLPDDSATSTFISIGKFESEIEAVYCSKYLKTKMLRCLLGILKITQDNPPSVWSYVPLQDFTPQSDIDWSVSVAEIDQQLYKKYGLTAEEQAFIERMIKPME